MCSLGSVNAGVADLQQDVQALFARNADSDQRIKFLEYKTIDLEARIRRNNLIFRGHNELVNGYDCVSIIRTFLSDKFKLDPTPIHIQRAHRRWANVTAQQRGPRPIIVCFRDYNDVELIMSNANKLRGTIYGINRDYPREIMSLPHCPLPAPIDLL